MVSHLSEILSLPSFVYASDAFQNYTDFNLLWFLVGMCSIWDSVALLFLLLSQRCVRKTSPSSGLCSWGFKWRSVLWLCTCTASALACLLQVQCWWLYSGLSCTWTLPISRKAESNCLLVPLPLSLAFLPSTAPSCCLLMQQLILRKAQTGRPLVRKSNAGKGSNLFGRSLPQPPAGCPAKTWGSFGWHRRGVKEGGRPSFLQILRSIWNMDGLL